MTGPAYMLWSLGYHNDTDDHGGLFQSNYLRLGGNRRDATSVPVNTGDIAQLTLTGPAVRRPFPRGEAFRAALIVIRQEQHSTAPSKHIRPRRPDIDRNPSI